MIEAGIIFFIGICCGAFCMFCIVSAASTTNHYMESDVKMRLKEDALESRREIRRLKNYIAEFERK